MYVQMETQILTDILKAQLWSAHISTSRARTNWEITLWVLTTLLSLTFCSYKDTPYSDAMFCIYSLNS